MPRPGPLQTAYGWIARDPDVRSHEGIGDEAARRVPESFFLQLGASIGSKLGDSFSDPKLVLTWLLQLLGAPAAAVAALVPVREAGSLVPQLAISGFMSRYAIHKWFWVLGSLLQAGCVILMGTLASARPGPAIGWMVVGLVALFSLGRSACSISAKDILGKTVPKRRRGRLSGFASSSAGAITLAVGLAFLLRGERALAAPELARLLFVAGGFWCIAAIVMSRVPEQPGPVESDGNALIEAFRSFGHLAADRDFRNFCLARSLLASTVLSFPFYVILAQRETEGRLASLGLLLIASAGSTALSGTVWGWLSDQSSRRTLAAAGTAAGLIGCLTAWVGGLELDAGTALWVYGCLFFLVGLAHTGIRLGRKTYVVDLATGDTRASYVAVSNTLIGGVLLVSGSFGALTPWIGERGVILLFALLGLLGGTLAWFLREVEQEEA